MADIFFSVGILLVLLLGTEVIGETEPELRSEEFKTAFAKASWDFALDLIKTSSNNSVDNLVVSPSSIAVLLAVLQQGAGGNTADQIQKVLRLSSENSKIGYGHLVKYLREEQMNLTLEWGNRLFVTPGFNISETFARSIEDHFDAGIEELDFNTSMITEAAAKINDWVRETTHGYICDLVDPSLFSSDVIMVMANAMYFKSFWDCPFKKYKTKVDKFHSDRDKKLEVPFMRQAGRFAAGEDVDLEAKWVELPFKENNFSMLFILPLKDDDFDALNRMTEKLEGSNLVQMIGKERTKRVKLAIPKFKLSKKISLVDSLIELGLTDMFSEMSDLKGITQGEESLRLSQVIHQADVEIDEDGSTAAAATLDIVQTLSLEWFSDELSFKADRPFLFFIVDTECGVPIFAGRVVDPST